MTMTKAVNLRRMRTRRFRAGSNGWDESLGVVMTVVANGLGKGRFGLADISSGVQSLVLAWGLVIFFGQVLDASRNPVYGSKAGEVCLGGNLYDE